MDSSSFGQTSITVAIETTDVIHQIRVRSSLDTFPSTPIDVNVPRSPNAPNATYNPASDAITGLANTREFSLDNGATWTRVVGSTITRDTLGNDAITVQIRIAATATAPISLIRVVEVPNGPAAAPAGFEIDFAREVLTGVASGMQWSTNGTSWTNITTNELNIAARIPVATATTNTNLRIRIASTATAPSSIPAEIILTPRLATPTATQVFFDGFTETISINDTMEYRIGTSGEWIQVAPGQTSIPATIGKNDTTHQVRMRGGNYRFPSAAFSVSAPARPTISNATYQASTDRITGVTSAMEFSLDNGATWTRVVGSTINRDALSDDATTVQVRIAATATAPMSLVSIVEVPNGPAAAPAGFEIDFAREVLTGVAPGMQWSTNGTSWTNITTNELDITARIPAATANANTNLRIRVAPTATVPPSHAAEIILIPRFATPTTAVARFNGLTETISVNDTMEYRIWASGEWNQVNPGQTSIPVTIEATSVTHHVRVRNTNDRFASEIRNVNVPRRPNAPNVTYQAASDQIADVSNLMEFSLDNGATWMRVSGTAITRDALGNDAISVQVRVAATTTAPFSLVSVVEVPNGPAAAPTGLEVDFLRETLTGVAPGMQWSTNGTSWTNITTNELNINARIPAATATANTNLRIRIAPTATVPPSQAAEIILTPRPATPATSAVNFNGFTETISVNDTMEYRVGTSGEWIRVAPGQTSISAIVESTAAVTHQVRVRSAGDRFASDARNVSVPRRPNAPNATYNPVSDAITGLTATREFSLDNGVTWTRVVGNTITRDMLGDDAILVQIRIAATATAPLSLVRIVEVPGGPATAPVGFEIDFVHEVLTGVAPGMQWSTDGTAWTDITTNELNIAARIPAATATANTNLMIRVAATATAPPSHAAEITLTPRPATPATAAVRFDGFTETISVDDTMEFRIGVSGEWIRVDQGQTSISATIGAANATRQIRVRGTYDRFASAALNVTAPRRPAAPNAVYQAATDRITGVSNAMEFSLDNGVTWTRLTANNIPRDTFGYNAISVQVRIAATSTAPVSYIAFVQVPDGFAATPIASVIPKDRYTQDYKVEDGYDNEDEYDVEEEYVDYCDYASQKSAV